MTYFLQIDPINDYFYEIYVHKPDRNHCYQLLAKNYLTTSSKFWHTTSFWPPNYAKKTRFGPFTPKVIYFDQKYAFKDIFDQISVHNPDWNNI